MTFQTFKTALLIPLIAVGACSDSGANYRPIVDGTPSPAFSSDLQACQTLAINQYQGETAGGAAIGAGIGAVAGLLDPDTSDEEGLLGGLLVGGLTGAAATGIETNEKRKEIVIQCMRGRGHKVVG
ncbi:glycine zipper family protein [Pseudoprimorskyibacter insulae]|uniref:Glycine zipper domain-containing protein n=1 Tax=Pseudoprimorskyibacter insulae TaxID=1695997 RepID=A0A2R8AYS2_9RHOB|nr:glycine zipper family protein [Pseudoprimorskyibacter insulae]SPF81186.1 hypothetical protein PRI8871_03008 [Pseudoprimorskyibacter insulae]